MIFRLLVCALLWTFTLQTGFGAESDAYLILSDITWSVEGHTLTSHPRVLTRVGHKARISVGWKGQPGKPEELEGRTFSLEFNCHEKPGNLQFEMELWVGKETLRKLSHTSGTLLEGQTWEASLDSEDPDGKGGQRSSIEYRVTAWKVPPGKAFKSLDGDGKPVFGPEAQP